MRRLLLVALTAALIGCGTSPSTGGPTTTVRPLTNTSVPTSTTETQTAYDQLSTFLGRAESLYSTLKDAVRVIDASGPPWRTITSTVQGKVPVPSVLDSVAEAIPPGMPAALLQPGLLVYSDLYSAVLGIRRFGVVSTTIPPDQASQFALLAGVHNAEAALLRLPDDLANLRSLARSNPAFPLATVNSRDYADLLIYLADIAVGNKGCAGQGGYLYTVLPAITWKPEPAINSDGTLNWPDGRYENFTARFTSGTWNVQILVC